VSLPVDVLYSPRVLLGLAVLVTQLLLLFVFRVLLMLFLVSVLRFADALLLLCMLSVYDGVVDVGVRCISVNIVCIL